MKSKKNKILNKANKFRSNKLKTSKHKIFQIFKQKVIKKN